jgi:glycosyltransferase involved in cell wall biosynthesis
MNENPAAEGRRLRVGLVANEFFDSAVGRLGGFGWATRQVARLFSGDPSLGVDLTLLTGELRAARARRQVEVHGTKLVLREAPVWRHVRALQRERLDLLLTIDYRPNYRAIFRALPRTPVVVWVRDPRSPEDVAKVSTLRIPAAEHVEPEGIQPFDCTSLAGVARLSRLLRRPMLFATPAPHLTEKTRGTYGLDVPELHFLPNIITLGPKDLTKSERPRVVFLGRLDPIKRPWLFAELARAFPEAEFLFLGKAHSDGDAAWRPGDLPPNVRLMGHLGEREKLDVLSSAWVLVNTSIHEALAISFLEALACEMPILSCQDPGGLVSRFGVYTGRWDGTGMDGMPSFVEGLGRLIGDGDTRRALGAAGRRWVSETHTPAGFLAAFDRLCALAGAGSRVEGERPGPGDRG